MMATPPGPEPSTAVPTCYRHPDRETYVSCSRCGRPACPDCLRAAPVGQHCVECVREGSQATRQASGRFGGRVPTSGPVVTWTLIGLNLAVYLIELAYPRAIDSGSLVGGAGYPAIHAFVGVAFCDWYRLLSSAFLHEPPGNGLGLAHIAFNMWALWIVGPALEQNLGRLRYLAVYLISALGGSALFYLIVAPDQPAIGASGAIFGLFGAWFVIAKRLRVDSRQVVMLIVLNLFLGFVIPNVGWQAHVGGLVTGAALTAAYAYAPRRNRTLVQVSATVAMLALVVALVVIRDLQLAHTVIVRL